MVPTKAVSWVEKRVALMVSTLAGSRADYSAEDLAAMKDAMKVELRVVYSVVTRGDLWAAYLAEYLAACSVP